MEETDVPAAAGGADPPQALPPRSGYRRRSTRAAMRLADSALDAGGRLMAGSRLDRLAEAVPKRRVTVLAVYGPARVGMMGDAVEELGRSRHGPRISLGAIGAAAPALVPLTDLEHLDGGKLANLNLLASEAVSAGDDWVLLLDDDVGLPPGFLDRLIALAEHFRLDLAQPALSLASHTAFPTTRRRAGAILRRTPFVEMGPAVLMRRAAFAELTPFPEEGMGWGICLTWAATAARHGWRLGIADAVVARHETAPPGAGYDREAAISAARDLLASREHIGWREADTVLETHRRL